MKYEPISIAPRKGKPFSNASFSFYSGEIGHVFRMKSAIDSGGNKAS
jgi:hypothetical protein